MSAPLEQEVQASLNAAPETQIENPAPVDAAPLQPSTALERIEQEIKAALDNASQQINANNFVAQSLNYVLQLFQKHKD